MIANEEGVIGRENAVIEDGKRCLQLRRSSGEAEQRPFLRVRHQRALAILEGQAGRISFGCKSGTRRGMEKVLSG
jgi:hypothetical protein